MTPKLQQLLDLANPGRHRATLDFVDQALSIVNAIRLRKLPSCFHIMVWNGPFYVLATEVAFCRGATCSVRHQYQPNIGLLHHPPGTPVGGQFLMYIRALRATLNKADRSFNSVSLYNQLAICHSWYLPGWKISWRLKMVTKSNLSRETSINTALLVS